MEQMELLMKRDRAAFQDLVFDHFKNVEEETRKLHETQVALQRDVDAREKRIEELERKIADVQTGAMAQPDEPGVHPLVEDLKRKLDAARSEVEQLREVASSRSRRIAELEREIQAARRQGEAKARRT